MHVCTRLYVCVRKVFVCMFSCVCVWESEREGRKEDAKMPGGQMKFLYDEAVPWCCVDPLLSVDSVTDLSERASEWRQWKEEQTMLSQHDSSDFEVVSIFSVEVRR